MAQRAVEVTVPEAAAAAARGGSVTARRDPPDSQDKPSHCDAASRSYTYTACIAPKSERPTVRSIADAKDRLVTVNSALPKASALDPQPVLGRVGVVSGRLYGILVIA